MTITLSTNYRDLADGEDATLVVTSTLSHFDLCWEFLDADKEAFVDKPLTLQYKDTKALAESAEHRKRILQVGHID